MLSPPCLTPQHDGLFREGFNFHVDPTLNAMGVIASALGLTIFQLWEKVRRVEAI